MILLITSRDGAREVITDVDAVKTQGLRGARTIIQIVRGNGSEAGVVELHDAQVELLPDDPDAR